MLLLLLCLFQSIAVAVYVPVVPSSLRVTVLREDVPSHCEEVNLDFLVASHRGAIVETIEQASDALSMDFGFLAGLASC